MAKAGAPILFLAGRMTDRDEIRCHQALADELARLGLPSRLICQSIGPDHRLGEVIEVPQLAWRKLTLPWVARWASMGFDANPPRMMHVLGLSMADAGMEIAERWQVPYLLAIDEFPRRDAKIRLSRAWCRGLISTNDELEAALVRDYGVPASMIRTIPRGVVESKRARPVNPSSRVPVIGAMGPLIPGSGFATFLNAARRVVDHGIDAEFLLAGEGEGEDDLRRRAERLRIADRLTFADDQAINLTFWDVLDIYCQTSVSPSSGRPLVVARSHGVPVIASDVEGLRHLVDDDASGLRIPHGEPDSLASAIVDLLDDPARMLSIGERGQSRTAGSHTIPREAERLAELYAAEMASGASTPIVPASSPPHPQGQAEGEPVASREPADARGDVDDALPPAVLPWPKP